MAVPGQIEDPRIILAVDTVAFRLLVTITKDGQVRGLKRLKKLQDDDLFIHFVRDPNALGEFLEQHWKEPDCNIFVFHI
jgi:hypothetical protein